ncbi:MAG: amidase domain-containing protein [Clostridia bacterium]|nr:amidase domain-containing protein [Clostridia bacterium]
MKKFRKTLALLLAIISIATTMFGFSIQASAASYNPSAAASYALKYWNNYNSSYSNYNSIGGDCANFVSQCLRAGGLPMDDNWYWYSYNNHSASWTGALSLKKYLVDRMGYKLIKSPSASDLSVGDVLWYNEGDHVSFVSEIINGQPYICAHNTNLHTQNWRQASYFRSCDVIKMSSKSSSSYSVDNSYPVPFIARTISTSNVTCYNSINGSVAGSIYPSDDVIIKKVYNVNGTKWIEGSCPWGSNGAYKTIYVKLNVFINSNNSPVKFTAPKKTDTFLRSNDTAKWGWIDSKDVCYKIYTNSDRTYVIYPAGSGKLRGAWAKTTSLSASQQGSYVDVWLSTSNGSSEYKSPVTGTQYRAWFAIRGKNDNKLYDTYSNKTNYKSTITVYNPDGSKNFGYSYEGSCYDWIRFTPKMPGSYRIRIQVSGCLSGDYSEYVNIGLSAPSLSLTYNKADKKITSKVSTSSTISYYQISYSRPGKDYSDKTLNLGKTYSITSVKANTKYTVRVRAVYKTGNTVYYSPYKYVSINT